MLREESLRFVIKLPVLDIDGLVVTSEKLVLVYKALLNRQILSLWANADYPSLKPLRSWVNDLIYRCAFIDYWIRHGQLKSYWMFGFTRFPIKYY